MVGRRVLITGAGGSLGTSLSLACAQRGDTLLLLDVNPTALDRTAQRLPAGTPPRRLVLDVADAPGVRRAVEQLIGEGMIPDLVIHSAALSLHGEFRHLPLDEWVRLLDVNLRGVMTLTQALLPAMVARRSGYLLFISSLSGFCASPGSAPYAASKQALHGFAESLYFELRPHGIGVSVVCPSTLRSEIAARMGVHLGPATSTVEAEAWRARRARLHQTRGLSCERVAARCLQAVDRRQFLTLVGWDTQLAYLAKRLLGSWFWRCR